MKKNILILTVAAIAFSTNIALARNVSENEAKVAAAHYLETQGNGYKVDVADLTLILTINNPELNIPSCYFFNVSDWGWIIMSASTVTDPIVAYNDNGRALNMSELPSNMMWWVNGYAALIAAKQVEETETTLEEDKMWYILLDDTYKSPEKGAKANITLLQEEWGQGNNEGSTYNMFCPRYNGVATVTGCVATALSQIIHYYKFPIQGSSLNQYRWCNTELGMTSPGTLLKLKFDTMFFDYSLMPNIIYENTPYEQRREVSRLCYAVGVGMNMNYGTSASGGSGAHSSDVPKVMANHFKYNRCEQIIRESCGDSAFMAQIRGELELNRPVYMSGTSLSSVGNDDRHAWVCDGYKTNSQKMYHMNWGWYSNGDGFYNLYDNTDAGMRIWNNNTYPAQDMRYTFTLEQTAMIGLIPPHRDSSAIDFMPPDVGIAALNMPELYAAYPNPAYFSITLPYSIQNTENLIIYNIEGKVMEQHILQPSTNHIDINVTNMPAGIYIYRVGGATGKFVVQ